jgi:hypothetical protein
MKETHKIIFLSAALFVSSVLLPSCSEKTPAKDPPAAKPKLVSELFDSIEKGDHAGAVAKIGRLRKIEDSTFLADTELLERQNLAISQVQEALDTGNIDGAIEICSDAIDKIPKNDALIEIKKTLLSLKQIEVLVDAVKRADDSVALARAAGRLKTVSETYCPAGIFAKIANEKLLLAKKMMSKELKLGIIDLSCEIISTPQKDNSVKQSMMALLFVIDQDNPLLNPSE